MWYYIKDAHQQASPEYYRKPPKIVTIPVRHPLDLNQQFGICTFEQKKLHYVGKKFTNWEVNARDLMVEVNGVIENGQEWALRDSIAIAYTPYNRVMWNKHLWPSEPNYEPEFTGGQFDVKNLLVSGSESSSQYGIANPDSFYRAWTGDNGKNSDYIYEISLIIAYGVHRGYFIDTSFGATEYRHIPEMCVANGPAFFTRDPELRETHGATWTDEYTYNGISTEQLWEQQGWNGDIPEPDRYPAGCR
jgi:hypothetical protein